MRSYVQGAVKVGATPVRVCTIPQDVSNAILHNSGPATVFVGGDTVAAHGDLIGLPLAPNEKLGGLDAYEHDSTDIYAVAEEGKGMATVIFLVMSGV